MTSSSKKDSPQQSQDTSGLPANSYPFSQKFTQKHPEKVESSPAPSEKSVDTPLPTESCPPLPAEQEHQYSLKNDESQNVDTTSPTIALSSDTDSNTTFFDPSHPLASTDSDREASSSPLLPPVSPTTATSEAQVMQTSPKDQSSQSDQHNQISQSFQNTQDAQKSFNTQDSIDSLHTATPQKTAQQEPSTPQQQSTQQEPTSSPKVAKKSAKKPSKSPSSKKTSPKADGFLSSHPILTTTPTIPGGLSNALFTTCSYAPWIILTLLFVLQTLFTLDARNLWYSDEVRHAAVFTAMLNNGKFFMLELNGQPYPDKPSLYFWFLRGLYEIIQENGPRLYLGAAAISGLLYLWATLFLGRLVGRFDGRSLLAGGILLISGGYFIGVTHYARMDLLFSVCIIASYITFFIAFTKTRSLAMMISGFTFAALACLIKGPLGIALPLGTLLLFALWRGKFRRFIGADFFIGLLVALLIVGAWLGGLYYEAGYDYIHDEIFFKQIGQRAFDAFHHKFKWAFYLERLPLLILPWVPIILCLPFHKVFSQNARAILLASRKPEREGQAYLWCIILSALLILSAISSKILIYLLPALPAMCLVAGRAVLHLVGRRAILFKMLLATTLLLAGFAFFIASLKVFGSFPLPEFIENLIPNYTIPPSAGFFIATGILCATALFLFFGIPSSRPEAQLLVLALMGTGLAYPLFGMAAPSLDTILSTKAQGDIFKDYIQEGYHPLTFDIYDGVYTYYAETTIDEVKSVEAIEERLTTHPKIIIAISQKDLTRYAIPQCFTPVHKQLLERHEMLLMACPPLAKEELSTIEENEAKTAETPAIAPTESDDKGSDSFATPQTLPETQAPLEIQENAAPADNDRPIAPPADNQTSNKGHDSGKSQVSGEDQATDKDLVSGEDQDADKDQVFGNKQTPDEGQTAGTEQDPDTHEQATEREEELHTNTSTSTPQGEAPDAQ